MTAKTDHPTPAVPPPSEADLARDLADEYRYADVVSDHWDSPSEKILSGICCAAIRRAVHAEAVIAQHNLCHDLHGKVDARAFADGCAAEQRKLYGCALDADERDRLAKNLDAIVNVCALAGIGGRGQTVLCRVKDLHAALGQQIERADAAEAERDAERAKREQQEQQLVDICQMFGKDARGFGTVAKMVEQETARLRGVLAGREVCRALSLADLEQAVTDDAAALSAENDRLRTEAAGYRREWDNAARERDRLDEMLAGRDGEIARLQQRVAEVEAIDARLCAVNLDLTERVAELEAALRAVSDAARGEWVGHLCRAFHPQSEAALIAALKAAQEALHGHA